MDSSPFAPNLDAAALRELLADALLARPIIAVDFQRREIAHVGIDMAGQLQVTVRVEGAEDGYTVISL